MARAGWRAAAAAHKALNAYQALQAGYGAGQGIYLASTGQGSWTSAALGAAGAFGARSALTGRLQSEVSRSLSRATFRENLGNVIGRKLKRSESAHHLVAVNDPRAARAREAMARFGLDVNDPRINGAVVRRKVHDRMHTDKYYEYVEERVGKAKSRDEALRRLDRIRRAVEQATRRA